MLIPVYAPNVQARSAATVTTQVSDHPHGAQSFPQRTDRPSGDVWAVRTYVVPNGIDP